MSATSSKPASKSQHEEQGKPESAPAPPTAVKGKSASPSGAAKAKPGPADTAKRRNTPGRKYFSGYIPNSLHVADLDVSVNEEELAKLFNDRSHATTTIKIVRDRWSKISLGYAYVNFKTEEEAKLAKNDLNFLGLRGKPIRISLARQRNSAPRPRKKDDANLYVKNLHPSADTKALYEHFKAHGEISSCRVMEFEDGRSKGFGFVAFGTRREAMRAQAALHGSKLADQVLDVSFAHVKPKPNRSSAGSGDGQRRKGSGKHHGSGGDHPSAHHHHRSRHHHHHHHHGAAAHLAGGEAGSQARPHAQPYPFSIPMGMMNHAVYTPYGIQMIDPQMPLGGHPGWYQHYAVAPAPPLPTEALTAEAMASGAGLGPGAPPYPLYPQQYPMMFPYRGSEPPPGMYEPVMVPASVQADAGAGKGEAPGAS